MARHAWIFVIGLAACGFPAPINIGNVAGQVHGLWDGSDSVALRLQSPGKTSLVAVPVNGAFQFPDQLAEGAVYTITVDASPVQHTCVVAAGGTGTFGGTDVDDVAIACTGPALAIDLTGPWGWAFDASKDGQTFDGSIATQQVAMTVHGDTLTSASIAGTDVPLGQRSTAMPLPLGPTTISVAVTAGGGLSKTYPLTFNRGAKQLEQLAYGKASNTDVDDKFGDTLSVSGDTLVVGANGESSNATGVDGDQANNNARDSGAAYVFVRKNGQWQQEAYLKASNTGGLDAFGLKVAISGNTIAVVAGLEGSNATGINGNQSDNSIFRSGAVYVFVRGDAGWTQQAYLKASNNKPPPTGDSTGLGFGSSIALSGDTLVVGAAGEDSDATGVNRDQTNTNALNSGAVYVFGRAGITWTQQAYLKASNTNASDGFGGTVALFGDTLAVSATGEASKATGANGDQSDNSLYQSGAVYVFVRDGAVWTQQAYLKASNTEMTMGFGYTLAGDGDTLAVGAPNESSKATGVDGDQADMSLRAAGAAYVFIRQGTTWTQQAYLKASNTDMSDSFGGSLALANDVLAVGATGEASSATGINGDQGNGALSGGSGAVYVFERTGTTWAQQFYVKASNTGGSFGRSIAISGDGIIVGAGDESSAATGIDPVNGQADVSASLAGACYIFR